MVIVNVVNDVVWQLQGQTGTKLGSNRNQGGVINQIGVGQEPDCGQAGTNLGSNRHFDGIMRVRAVMTNFDQ